MTYTAEGPCEVAFTSSFPGRIVAKELKAGESIIAQKTAFLCAFTPGYFDIGEAESVKVSTEEELLSAIGTNKEITLSPGTYDLTKLTEEAKEHRLSVPYDEEINRSGYKMDEEWTKRYPNIISGFQGLVVNSVYNLDIKGYAQAQIVTENPQNDVLTFLNCQNCTLDGITFGHDAEPGSCSGDCVNLSNCSDITLDALNLYGCGAFGIEAVGCDRVKVKDTDIHDCTYGLVTMRECWEVTFEDCFFRRTDGYTLIDVYANGVSSFKHCSFEYNSGDLFPTGEWTGIRFEDCSFTEEERKFLDANMEYVEYFEHGGNG